MPAGRPARLPALLGAVVLLAAIGALVSGRLRPGAEEGESVCPRNFGQTQLAAVVLWENAGGSMAPAPEVRRLTPEDLTPLADPEDAESCSRLMAALPDTLRPAVLSRHQVGLYRVGELFIVAVIANHTPAELDDMARGDTLVERPGETRIYDRDFRLLATYPN